MGKQGRLRQKQRRQGERRLEVARGQVKPILIFDDGRPWAPEVWLAADADDPDQVPGEAPTARGERS